MNHKNWRDNNLNYLHEYYKKWRENNKEDVKLSNRLYYLKNKEKIIEKVMIRYNKK